MAKFLKLTLTSGATTLIAIDRILWIEAIRNGAPGKSHVNFTADGMGFITVIESVVVIEAMIRNEEVVK